MAFLSRNARAIALAAALAGGVCAAPAQAQEPSLEYAVKANYLYKFTPFVEWPARAFGGPNDPFNICVAGQDPFGAALDDAVRGQRVGGRPVAVLRLASVAKGAGCHVLFAGRSRIQTAAQMVQAVAGQPVLTVVDQGAEVHGAIVQFLVQGGHVRFSIDASTAAANGVTISSKLLGLAAAQRGTGR